MVFKANFNVVPAKLEVVECVACSKPSIVKDYRTRYGITDGYAVCEKHMRISDEGFWAAVTRKEKKTK